MTYDPPDGARSYTGRFALGPHREVTRLGIGDLELVDPPLRPRPIRLGPLTLMELPDALLPFAGRYELGPTQLRMVLPADLRRERFDPPDQLTSPVGWHFDLITFERVTNPPTTPAPEPPSPASGR